MKFTCCYDMIGLQVYLLYGVIKRSSQEMVKALWIGKKDDVIAAAEHVQKTRRGIRLKSDTRENDSHAKGAMFNVYVPSKGIKTFVKPIRDNYYIGGLDHVDSLETIVFANNQEDLMDRGYKLFKDLMVVESSIPLIKPWVVSIMESQDRTVSETFHPCDVIGVDGVLALEVSTIEPENFERFLLSNYETMAEQAQQLVAV